MYMYTQYMYMYMHSEYMYTQYMYMYTQYMYTYTKRVTCINISPQLLYHLVLVPIPLVWFCWVSNDVSTLVFLASILAVNQVVI